MTPDLLILAQANVSSMDRFLQMLVSGLALGSIYALLAMGFVIIFKATSVLNFAHGALVAIGAFLVAIVAVDLEIPGRWLPGAPEWLTWSLAALIGVTLGGLMGLVLERVFIRPMIGEPLFQIVILTVGLDIILRTIVDDIAGLDGRPLSDPWGIATQKFGNVTIPQTQLVQFAVTIAAVASLAAFFRTRIGIAMRATAFDQEVARAQGIKVGRIFGLSWFLGALLAGTAGIFASIFPRAAGVSSGTAFLAFGAFPAIILGGLDSVLGAVLGGLIIGLAESAASVYLVAYNNILGTGAIVTEADGPANPDEIANAIVAADPDIVFLTGRSQDTEAIYSLAIGQGLEAIWTGAFPSFSPRFIAPGSPIAEQAARDFIIQLPWTPWAAGTDGINAFKAAVLGAGIPATEFYTEGAVEATVVHRILAKAIENGDLTQAGVLAAAKSIENLDFGGIAPSESYVGDMNAQLQRVGNIVVPDPEDLATGGTGFALIEANYTHQSVADYDFVGACYKLG